MTSPKCHKSKMHILHTLMTHTKNEFNLNPIDSFFISWIIQHFFPVWFPYIQQNEILTRLFLAIIIEPLYVIQHKIHTGTQIIHILYTSMGKIKYILLNILREESFYVYWIVDRRFTKSNELMYLSYSAACIFIFPNAHLRGAIWQFSNNSLWDTTLLAHEQSVLGGLVLMRITCLYRWISCSAPIH